MDFSSAKLSAWERNAICTLPKNVARKRSNNKLKSWPNIRCRVRAEVWNDYEKNSYTEEWKRGWKKKEIMHSVSQWAFKNPCSPVKCLLSCGIALRWYIPEGKESHFACITLKRSQGEQTGMRELVSHQETRGLKRRSEKRSGRACSSDVLIFS